MSDFILKEAKDVLNRNDIANQLAPQQRIPVKDYLQERAATHYVMENERLHAEIEALRAENARLMDCYKGSTYTVDVLIKDNARLREALKPFADEAAGLTDEHDDWPINYQSGDSVNFTFGQLRAARAAMACSDPSDPHKSCAGESNG